ncbi:MAG TPA: nitronate monooxygenase [Pseudogracilibacillus sp.]|nr:nitronate monooxygenase [Pseudogracilibacillus sp.]
MLSNTLTKLLQLKYPIIQAPMAGGITTTKLVTAVSSNGGLGMIGAGYMGPDQLRHQIKEIKQKDVHNFGVNLFVPNDFTVTDNDLRNANELLQPIRETLNTHTEQVELPTMDQMTKTFHEQIKVVLEERVPICSFTFAVPSKEDIATLKQQDIFTIGTATTVQEAMEVEHSGMDAVVLQGVEAGGHRGSFIDATEENGIGLMALIPQVVDTIEIPVIAAGGIMDGRGLAASLCLGAQGVQMGTAFLTTEESGAHDVHKEAILHTQENEIILTRSFSGKLAQGIKNDFTEQIKEHEDDLPAFPIQNTLTQSIRKAASQENNKEFMSLWSGQSPRLAKKQTVKNLMETIITQVNKIKRNE